MTRFGIAAALTAALAGAVGAQLKTPAEWQWRTDGPATLMTAGTEPTDTQLYFVAMPPGWHVTTGPGSLLYHPEYAGRGNFAVEAGYTDLGKGSASQAGVGSASLEASGFEIVAVGIMPLNPKWSLYGKAGFFIWDVDLKLSPGLGTSESESGTDLTFAFGVGWDITKSFGVRFEYQVYSNLGDENTTGEGDVNVLGANAIFRF